MTEEKLMQAALYADRLHNLQRLFDVVNNNPNSVLHIVSSSKNVDAVIPKEFYGPLIVAINKHIRIINEEIEAL